MQQVSSLLFLEMVPSQLRSQLHKPVKCIALEFDHNRSWISSLSMTVAIFTSLVPAQTPPSHEEKGLVTIERFLGCAELAVLTVDYIASHKAYFSGLWAHLDDMALFHWIDCWLSTTKKSLNSHQILFLMKKRGLGMRLPPAALVVCDQTPFNTEGSSFALRICHHHDELSS